MMFNETVDDLMNRVRYEGEAYFTVTSYGGAGRYGAIRNAAKRAGFEIDEVDYDIFGGTETYRISKGEAR